MKMFSLSSTVEEKEDEGGIPGLDWQEDQEYIKEQAFNEKVKSLKKVPYSKPIPRNFEKAWLGHEIPQPVEGEDQCECFVLFKGN